ncbi:MAG: sigma-54-dependent Fis family transcriptional regulator [SAR324 cluster bacterium]|uniref:Sigma-54-dependent Fis family transcriptional regulator n=1 Tax=SAR324 cluster bacterium TaxID=2024889 RepID=A0A7X9ILG1_9DELT|nr:sigma-54-dependent Fis family transcriptional regulator [SAR324 cluster bacterium]
MQSCIQNLKIEGFQTYVFSNLGQVKELARTIPFSSVFIELGIAHQDNFRFIEQFGPNTTFVIISKTEERDLALSSLSLGIHDFIEEPVSSQSCILAIQKRHIRDSCNPDLWEENKEQKKTSFSNIIAESPEMHEVFNVVKRLSGYNTTVLITGESGTGKELIARAIHNSSPRHKKPFIAINCGAIPENLLEAELFGYRKGSFTDAVRDKKGLLEEASGGTVFLDEIGEMPPHLQVKLLRALQERQIQPVGEEGTISIDVRIIAATLRDLETDIKNGRFREDLYYRLNVVSIHIPPLRTRQSDIIPLANFFVKKHAKRLGIPPKKISKAVEAQLYAYPWKGNVRELENCIERALVMSEDKEIEINSLPESLKNIQLHETHALQDLVAGDNLSIKNMTKELEIALIKRALKKTRGNRTHAAKVLEISHRALLYKMKEYGIKD